MIELVEMEVRELLSFYGFDGDNAPVIAGSALGALNGEPKWVEKVMELMNAVDEYIPLPVRDNEKPFLMPIEDIFSITSSPSQVVVLLLPAVLRQVSLRSATRFRSSVSVRSPRSQSLPVSRCSARSSTRVRPETT